MGKVPRGLVLDLLGLLFLSPQCVAKNGADRLVLLVDLRRLEPVLDSRLGLEVLFRVIPEEVLYAAWDCVEAPADAVDEAEPAEPFVEGCKVEILASCIWPSAFACSAA